MVGMDSRYRLLQRLRLRLRDAQWRLCGGNARHLQVSLLIYQPSNTNVISSHLAEEIPYAQRNVPIAIGLQKSRDVVTGLFYIVAIMYAINDYDALFESAFPVTDIYR